MRKERDLPTQLDLSPHMPTIHPSEKVPQRSSLLPSQYSLSPPGSSSMETPVHSPEVSPLGLFSLGLVTGLSSCL